MAIQAAAVTALVVVAYATLLRPEGPSPISRIEAPNGGATTHVDAGNRPGKRQAAMPDAKPNAERDRGDASSRRGAAASVPGEGLVAATGAVTPGKVASVPQTPPGDQYADAVTALLDRVGSAHLPGQ